jgi:hypothetical protein
MSGKKWPKSLDFHEGTRGREIRVVEQWIPAAAGIGAEDNNSQ